MTTASKAAKLELYGFVDAFGEAMVVELAENPDKLAKTWHTVTRENQEDHILTELEGIIADYDEADTPVPWLKIALLAMTAWVREKRPDLFPVDEPDLELPF